MKQYLLKTSVLTFKVSAKTKLTQRNKEHKVLTCLRQAGQYFMLLYVLCFFVFNFVFALTLNELARYTFF
jgi:hypothetical protein